MLARFGEHLLQIGDAGEHRRDRDEAHPDRIGEQSRDRGLAGARRPPEDHRGELPRRHHPPDRAVRPGQMLLPDHVLEPLRPQPVGERRVVGNRRRRRGARRRIVLKQVGHARQLAHFTRFGITPSPRRERAGVRGLGVRGYSLSDIRLYLDT
jgi:hypothetical protein